MENMDEKKMSSAINDENVLNGYKSETENPENENPETEQKISAMENKNRKRERKNKIGKTGKKTIPSKRKSGEIHCPFRSGSNHEFVFGLLSNGITFENLRSKLIAKYGEKTGHVGNVRMYIANHRTANVPVHYDGETGKYKIGNPEKSPKTENPETETKTD